MSYPAKVNVLIVEDEPEVKDAYREMLFDQISAGEVAEPRFAFCLEDAEAALQADDPTTLLWST